jgi:pSer/pThr/pTyr-binding forkhead associated (FHA) protein
MAIILLIKTEEGQLTELPIFNKIIIGRSSSSDYKIADIKISGSHCSFEVNAKGQLVFTDLGSSNGSFLNNSQIQQTMVRVNDVIRVGNTIIKIEEKKLSAIERLEIGVSLASTKNDKTLPDIGQIKELPAQKETSKKKTIILNKSHKEKKKINSNWALGTDNVIDAEESSGSTKFLKLDKATKKK